MRLTPAELARLQAMEFDTQPKQGDPNAVPLASAAMYRQNAVRSGIQGAEFAQQQWDWIQRNKDQLRALAPGATAFIDSSPQDWERAYGVAPGTLARRQAEFDAAKTDYGPQTVSNYHAFYDKTRGQDDVMRGANRNPNTSGSGRRMNPNGGGMIASPWQGTPDVAQGLQQTLAQKIQAKMGVPIGQPQPRNPLR